MRHIFTISVDSDLEKEIDGYQSRMGYNTRSEGAIRLIKKGLEYDSEIGKLQDRIKELEDKQYQIHLPCSVCGKPMTIGEGKEDPIYKDMKDRYKNYGHSSCIKSEGDKK